MAKKYSAPKKTTPVKPAPNNFNQYILYGILVIAVIFVAAIAFTIGQKSGGSSSATGPLTTNREEKQYLDQITQYEQQLQANPNDAQVLLNLGNQRYDLGQLYLFQLQKEPEGVANFQAAVTAYQKYLTTDPKNMNVLVDMATSAFYSNQADLAEKTYKDALAIDPKHVQANLNYGVFLMHLRQDYQAALQQFEQVLALKPDAETTQKANQLITSIKEIQKKPDSSGNQQSGTPGTGQTPNEQSGGTTSEPAPEDQPKQ